jgi:hypothetical protein
MSISNICNLYKIKEKCDFVLIMIDMNLYSSLNVKDPNIRFCSGSRPAYIKDMETNRI